MQAEEETRRALAKERELVELKSRFVSMTSHEFRTPLSTILASADLLEFYIDRWPSERQLEHIQRIQSTVLSMTQMMDDILVIGRAEANRLDFRPSAVDLVQFCRDEIDAAYARPTRSYPYFLNMTGSRTWSWLMPACCIIS
ncbi:MAG: HAMP domain-containing histidine kinase [Anaerolineae bacterium]|nr:MAG: HAMP domain-containing histidine kinase [Anaerolineae bacterium]